MVPPKWSSNFSQKNFIRLLHPIFQHNFPAQIFKLFCQPNLATHFFHTIFNKKNHPLLSPNFPTRLFHTIFPHNYSKKFSTNNFQTIFNKFVHLGLPHNFVTQFVNLLFPLFSIPVEYFINTFQKLLIFYKFSYHICLKKILYAVYCIKHTVY